MKSALEGERKQVTVLFADVQGSMDLAEQLDPEEWHRIMDRFFRILADGVHRFEGTINEYRGDGIMALFGAPIAHEDHAAGACLSGAPPARRAQTRKRGGLLCQIQGWVKLSASAGQFLSVASSRRLDGTAEES